MASKKKAPRVNNAGTAFDEVIASMDADRAVLQRKARKAVRELKASCVLLREQMGARWVILRKDGTVEVSFRDYTAQSIQLIDQSTFEMLVEHNGFVDKPTQDGFYFFY